LSHSTRSAKIPTIHDQKKNRAKVGSQIKHVISVELSKSGQLRRDVRLAVEGRAPVSLINRYGGMLLDPAEVIERTKKILEVK